MEKTVLVRIAFTTRPVVAVRMPHGWTLKHPGPCGAAHCHADPCTFAEWHSGISADGWHYLPTCTGHLVPYLHAIMLAAAAGRGEVK